MRSLYFKLSLWSLATLVFCIFAFFFVASMLNRNVGRRGDPYSRTLGWQLGMARKAFEQGGRPALSTYMRELREHFPNDHYLTDGNGRDLLTGEDLTSLTSLAAEGPRFPFFGPSGRLVVVRPSADGQFKFIAHMDLPSNSSNLLPYFAIILAAIALFSYVLFRYLASPLRRLTTTVERFGHGDLTARVDIRRGDEFGALANRFNEMAGRIETLLTAERRLLEDVSHELRSPLARLQFALELVRTAPDQEVAVARMKREIDRLSTLVGHLVEVTRAEGDPGARTRESLDLSALATEIADDCRIEAEAKNCTIALHSRSGLRLMADRELLRRALENVLRNAIRYAPANSTIQLDLEQHEKSVEIDVRDFGPGVPEEMLERIFQPFFRVDASRDNATGGIGLGLAIARRAITLHHGQLLAENAAPGLRVRMELPLVA
ncbi:sensor histidine kinase [Bryobacter aggregatus]|uniref:sensor histidine kinase n=1 Tax=Bryobacter aggregatus TaxID=360054 RepID=UPI000689A6E0|nr:ATP-binding protein [Bryobacter aggregatus]